MHCFAIRQQNHAKVLAVSFLDPGPTSDSPILLDGFLFRISYSPFYPLQLDG